jgi:hypothetical protein
MNHLARYFRMTYGSHPLHLLTMVAGFALLGYILFVFPPATLWNPAMWSHSIAVWFAAAVIGHDLLLFPFYALIDRVLAAPTGRRTCSAHPKVPARNYIRAPALGAGLTLLIFLPGIIEQGAPTYHAATGQTQQPFLGRWLVLTAAMFALSSVVYTIRVAAARRRLSAGVRPGVT